MRSTGSHTLSLLSRAPKSTIMQKIIAVLLIVGGLLVGYLGVDKVQSSSASAEILGIEIEANDNSGRQMGFVYLGLGVVLFAGGLYVLRGASK